MKIGVVGQGFVGSAITAGLTSFYDILTYDIDLTKCNCGSLKEVIEGANIIFQCLPTPMKKTGECDVSIVESSLTAINDICHDLKTSTNENKVVVIKSTVPPGTTQRLNSSLKNIDICFSPEFLTEANSFEDFKNQTRIIIGGDGAKVVKGMFRKPFPNIPIVVTKSKTAEMVKYFTNCFLATKVTFANEMYELCNAVDIDMDKVVEYVLYDTRIGKSHLAVPGPDGDCGFGGHCFPKDLSAMIYFGHQNVVNTSLMESVKNKNDQIRSNRNWETMLGRAISKEDD